MSYHRDNNANTRGPGAIAAVDKVSPRLRNAVRARARAMMARDRALARTAIQGFGGTALGMINLHGNQGGSGVGGKTGLQLQASVGKGGGGTYTGPAVAPTNPLQLVAVFKPTSGGRTLIVDPLLGGGGGSGFNTGGDGSGGNPQPTDPTGPSTGGGPSSIDPITVSGGGGTATTGGGGGPGPSSIDPMTGGGGITLVDPGSDPTPTLTVSSSDSPLKKYGLWLALGVGAYLLWKSNKE